MRIRNITATLKTFDLPSRSLHLPGRGRIADKRNEADITEAEYESAQIRKAEKYKWIRVLKDKTQAPKPVASPTLSVTEVEPNNSSDSE